MNEPTPEQLEEAYQRAMSTPKILEPGMALLSKLGSIAVHAEEMLSPQGHEFDAETLKTLLADGEIVAWLKGMNEMALLPKKR